MLSATFGVQAIDNDPFGTKLVFTCPVATPERVPKFSDPSTPPVPVVTEQPGVIVADT
ncbi:hypothetical protein D3C85_1911680 [compost metagenome]